MLRKRGDINNNGKVDTLDAVYILGHIRRLEAQNELVNATGARKIELEVEIERLTPFDLTNDKENLRASDINANGNVLISDVSYLLNNKVGNEGYPISGSLFTYEFQRDSFTNTVNYSGQTARLGMANEIHTALNSTSYAGGSIKNMYLNTGANFPSETTYDSSKQIWEKLGYGYSTSNSDAEANVATIQADFQKHIDNFNSIVTMQPIYWEYNVVVTEPGTPGVLVDGDDKRKVNAKGLEINQMLTKSTIGALSANNAMNYYLTKNLLDSQSNDVSDLRSDGSTNMEHKWDEAFGYCLNPTTEIKDGEEVLVDILLHKYIMKLKKRDVFEQAFYRGREAIANGDYEKRDEQATILKGLIADVLIQKAKDYVTAGRVALAENGGALNGAAAHDLSEGYGFIYSLQFIAHVPGKSYTRAQVEDMLDILTKGNGLWDLTDSDCVTLLDMIENPSVLHVAYFRTSDLATESTLEGNSDGPGQYVSKSIVLSNSEGTLLPVDTKGSNQVYFRGMTGQSTSDEDEHDHDHTNTNWESLSLNLGNDNVILAETNYEADSLDAGAEGTRVFHVTSGNGKFENSSTVEVTNHSTFSKIRVH